MHQCSVNGLSFTHCSPYIFITGWSQEELQHHREVSSAADNNNGVFSDPYDASSVHFRDAFLYQELQICPLRIHLKDLKRL